MNSLVTKILRGSNTRISRLHDENGSRVAVQTLLKNGPSAVASCLLRKVTGTLSARPWISYSATAEIEILLFAEKCRVLEYGSGMSTLWLAKRASTVLSIEDNAEWSKRVQTALQKHKITNIEYRVSTSLDQYADTVRSDQYLGAFDFILIDGPQRQNCAALCEKLLAPGGAIYLDNSDKKQCPYSGDVPQAVRILRDLALQRGMSVTAFVDFAPGQLFVTEGLLFK